MTCSRRFRLDSLEMETKADAFPFYTVTLSDGKSTVRWQRACERANRDQVMAFIATPSDNAHSALFNPPVIYTSTIVVTIFGSLGVINALRKGLDLECACMGTILSVPLSTVALLEDVSMAVMAALMLFLGR